MFVRLARVFPTAALLAAAFTFAAPAQAGVSWSVGISAPIAPGVSVSTAFGDGGRGYYGPQYRHYYRATPVVMPPAVVVSAPVYPVYAPAPVVYAPKPVRYYAPRPLVVRAPVVQRPVYVHHHHHGRPHHDRPHHGGGHKPDPTGGRQGGWY